VREYRGLAAEGRWVSDRLLERWASQPAPPRTGRLDAVLCLALRGEPPTALPRWLDEPGARLIASCVAPLADAQATVHDAMQVAESLAGALAAAEPAYLTSDRDLDGFALDQITGDALLDMYGDDEARRCRAARPRARSRRRRPATGWPTTSACRCSSRPTRWKAPAARCRCRPKS
jgi:hypothetical protein